MPLPQRNAFPKDLRSFLHQFKGDIQHTGDTVSYIENKMGDYAKAYNDLLDCHMDLIENLQRLVQNLQI